MINKQTLILYLTLVLFIMGVAIGFMAGAH